MNPPDTDLRRLAQEASGLLATAVETAEIGGLLTPAWVAAAQAAADELEQCYTRAACGHPVACLHDGACGWCAAVQDARLHLEVRDEAREASARDLERRREAEARADALAAHVERLLRYVQHISPCARLVGLGLVDPRRVCTCDMEGARAATPASSLEAHDRGVRATALREAVEGLRVPMRGADEQGAAALAGVAKWLLGRVAAIEQGEP